MSKRRHTFSITECRMYYVLCIQHQSSPSVFKYGPTEDHFQFSNIKQFEPNKAWDEPQLGFNIHMERIEWNRN